MFPKTDEKHIQENIVELLKSMGYSYIPPKEIDSYKDKKGDLSLNKVLRERLNSINSFEYKGEIYKFDKSKIEEAIRFINLQILDRGVKGLAEVNKEITELLWLGKSYEVILNDGSKSSFNIRFIDFKDINRNSFHFTQEYKFSDKRVDIVLFINGLPLVLIELKADNIPTSEAISQMIRNQKETPELFKFSQILIAGNNHHPKYATTLSDERFYLIWKERVNLNFKDRETTNLDKLIFSLLSKDRLLEIIKDFILFDSKTKKIARYQQYFAIKRILKRIKEKQQGGVIWHTQGSGKSLTMVMLTKILKENFSGAKIIVVTDRKSLDKQISETFKNSGLEETKRAKSAKELIELLKSGSSVITTLIHKFEALKNEEVTIKDRVFILVDESHRTQGGELHSAMKRVFQNGIYLAFTGTPLLKREKSTYKKFGGEIHRYTIDEAVSDKAVLPLLYEGRMANQWINDKMGLDNNFQKITKDLNESEKADLKRKWTRFQKIASSSRRLEVIADDITDHFKKNLKNTPFKAMLATSSKYDALKYKEIFDRDGEIKSAVVISSPDMRQGESSFDSENRDFVINSWKRVIKNYSSVDRYEDEIKESFKEGDIELLIVVDKLLTGFDAPKAKVLYLDKELKEHNLLQAIARVNRVYQGKDNGLIIDYRGLLGELDSALTNYSSLSGFDEEDLKGAVFDIKEEIKKVKSLYKKLKELFKNVKFKDDMESYEISLKDKKKRELFYKYLGEFSRLLNLALGSSKLYDVLSRDEIKEYKEAVKFYRKLQNAVKLRYHEKVDFKKYESSMQKLLNTFISSNEVLETVEPVDIFDINFDKTIEHLTSDSAKADAIFSATTAYIRENLDRNPKFYQKLSDEIEKIIKRYKDKRISERDKLKYAKDIKRQLLKEEFDEYPKELNSILEKSLFDNLKDEFESLNLNQDILIKFIKSVAEVVEDISKKPDWRETKSKELEGEIEELLYNIEDNFNIEFDLDTITPKIIKVILANR